MKAWRHGALDVHYRCSDVEEMELRRCAAGVQTWRHRRAPEARYGVQMWKYGSVELYRRAAGVAT